jgi:hypothetical protein
MYYVLYCILLYCIVYYIYNYIDFNGGHSQFMLTKQHHHIASVGFEIWFVRCAVE